MKLTKPESFAHAKEVSVTLLLTMGQTSPLQGNKLQPAP